MLIIDSRANNNKQSGGLPHSEIHGSKHILGSPWLIAEYHVFHRLLLPRHPPNALFALDLIQKKSDGFTPKRKNNLQTTRWFTCHRFFWSKVILSRLNTCWCIQTMSATRALGLVYLTWTTCSFQSAYLRVTEEKANSKNYPQADACFTRLRPARYFGGQTML